MIKFSILIPIYNVEKYLRECLNSVFAQDLPEDEYEVICVNDGSTDSSRDIVVEYLSTHSNLQLIDHPCNMKLGAARNTGRKVAKGKYIWYVDSDDKIAENCLNELFCIADERKVDVLEFDFDFINDEIERTKSTRHSNVITGQEYLMKYYLNDIGAICPIWKKIYLRSFLDQNDIFSPPINMGEDEPFSLEVFLNAKRFSYHTKCLYHYRTNNSSLTGSIRNKWSYEKWYESSLICARYMDRVYYQKKSSLPSVLQKSIEDMIKYDAIRWLIYKNSMDNDVIIKYRKKCRKDFFKNKFVFRYYSTKQLLSYIMMLSCF